MIRLKNSFSFSQQASQKAWCKQGGQDWISQLRCLLIVFSVHKSMSGTCHQSWVHQEVLRKPNISSLYWLRMWSESETSIDDPKVRLDLAVSHSTRLIPLNLLLNTQSMIVYNNSLKKAGSGLRLGVSKSVNLEMKSVRVGSWTGAYQKSTDRPLTLQIQWTRLQLRFVFSWTGLSLLDSWLVLLKAPNHEYDDSLYYKSCILTKKADH